MTAGEKLKAARKARKITGEQLAKELGVSDSSVYMWESDNRIPRDSVKKKIAEFFNMSIIELFYCD